MEDGERGLGAEEETCAGHEAAFDQAAPGDPVIRDFVFHGLEFFREGEAIVGRQDEGDRDDQWDRTGVYNGREGKSLFIAIPMGESRTVSFTSTVPEDATAPHSVRYTPTVTQTPVTVDPGCEGMFPAAAE